MTNLIESTDQNTAPKPVAKGTRIKPISAYLDNPPKPLRKDGQGNAYCRPREGALKRQFIQHCDREIAANKKKPTQDAFMKAACGWSDGAFSKIDRGTLDVHPAKAAKLVQALGCQLEDVFFSAEEVERHIRLWHKARDYHQRTAEENERREQAKNRQRGYVLRVREPMFQELLEATAEADKGWIHVLQPTELEVTSEQARMVHEFRLVIAKHAEMAKDRAPGDTLDIACKLRELFDEHLRPQGFTLVIGKYVAREETHPEYEVIDGDNVALRKALVWGILPEARARKAIHEGIAWPRHKETIDISAIEMDGDYAALYPDMVMSLLEWADGRLDNWWMDPTPEAED